VRKFFPILICILLSSSCGIVRSKSSESYLPGPAIRANYTPKGIVEELVQPCSVKGPENRRIIVYLPADYYKTDRKYPVLYLLHGARGYETSWIRKGEVYHTADSLWAAGKAEPCIIVMPNVNQYNDDGDYEGGRFKDAYESILEVDGVVESAFMQDVVGLIDSHYRTLPDQAHRAIGGLSIGGYQSLLFGANYPESFGYIAAMSPYMWSMGRPSVTRWKFYSHFHRKMKRQYEEYPPKGCYLYAGTTDMMRPATHNLHKYMEKKGYPHTYTKYPAGHDWANGWIEELKDVMQRIFKEP
jgi:enterochelin esterase family protein